MGATEQEISWFMD